MKLLLIDLTQDACDTLDHVVAEDSDVACHGHRLDASGPYCVFNAMDGLAQLSGDRPESQGNLSMGPHGSLPTWAALYSVRHTLLAVLDSGLTYVRRSQTLPGGAGWVALTPPGDRQLFSKQ